MRVFSLSPRLVRCCIKFEGNLRGDAEMQSAQREPRLKCGARKQSPLKRTRPGRVGFDPTSIFSLRIHSQHNNDISYLKTNIIKEQI